MRAIRNPDLALKALRHARTHGVTSTAEAARVANSKEVAVGYSSAGTVLDTGGIAEFSVGQRVACAGAGHANHAEFVAVPGNLVAAVPDNVSLRDAAFTTLGAIAMQGVRRAEPAFGERVVVVGLGLLGQLASQILRAAGCQVVGIEPVPRRRELAAEVGIERTAAPEQAARLVSDWSGGVGADAVVIAASSSSDALVNQAVSMVRRKGRVILVGAVGLGIKRPALYEREADVLISTSYGPGRYDPSYEEGGIDYPIAYVRWTENRNMEEFLRLLSTRQVEVDHLIEMEVPAEQALRAYAAVDAEDPPLAAVLTYEAGDRAREVPTRQVVRFSTRSDGPADPQVVTALVGAGSFVRAVHLPNLISDPNVHVKTIVTRSGITATDVARSINGAQAATDPRVAIEDPEVDLVLVGTRHDTHAELAAAALLAGKAVFVEKPLGLTREEIDEVWTAGADNDRLAIGFNRPFSPLAARMSEEVKAADGPIHVLYRVTAPLPRSHWLNDPLQGGGRILGEACHMFDFANWICGTPIRVLAAALRPAANLSAIESASITVKYADGSVAGIHYSGVGAKSMPKERIEVLRGGQSWVLDDFTALTTYGAKGKQTETIRHHDKGHARLMARVLAACRDEGDFEPGLVRAYVAQSVALAALDSIASDAAIDVVLPGNP
jgi:predicted dehydrogenase/threonine dehydrogenase-like Zn-dependent dehydrogenase